MRLLIKILFIFIFLGAFISCYKENKLPPNTTLQGLIVDACTHLPIKDATIKLMIYDGGGAANRTVSKVTTESDGIFEIKFYSRGASYWLYISANGYEEKPHEYINQYTNGTHLVMLENYSIHPSLQLKIKNVSPFDIHDSIYVHCFEPSNSFYTNGCNFSRDSMYRGINVDAIFSVLLCGCKPVEAKLNWNVRKNNILTSFSDSIICSGGGNNHFQINY